MTLSLLHRARPGPVAALALIALSALGPTFAAGPACASEAGVLLDDAARRNGLASWRDRKLAVTIESRDGDATTRVREAEVAERNDPDGGHRTFIEFLGPADVQGTLYLHLAPRDGDEQEWLFAPRSHLPCRPGRTPRLRHPRLRGMARRRRPPALQARAAG